MSKTSHRPDGSIWVRTFPLTFLHDQTQARCDPDWHHLTFAAKGHLEVITEDVRHVVPADRAVWVPAGTRHTAVMRAPISMRSLFVARGVFRDRRLEARVRTLAVTPLLRELMLQITRLGALDVRKPTQQRLAGVLIDLLRSAEDIGLTLLLPRDPRARALAERISREPGALRSTAELARSASASLRTLERCFLGETGLGLGAWRRRVRLFHALRSLEAGTPVTTVALEVGYANVSAFSQAFRAQFGRSPTGRTRPRASPARAVSARR
jgi:AraC-like DNA-binding protein